MEANLLLESYLKQLRRPCFQRNYRKFADHAAQANLSFDRYLHSLAEQEIAQRERNRQVRLIKAARFPVLKELADFYTQCTFLDFTCVPSVNKQQVLELAQGGYIRKAEPLLLYTVYFPVVGNPGLGKTHVATGLAVAGCRQGFPVRFYNAAALVNDLLQAADEHRAPKLLNRALKQNLLVLDEMGFIPFSATAAHLIFQFCSALYQKVALIITTNLRLYTVYFPVADSTQVFGDERLTAALLDRLTHKAHILEFAGAESYIHSVLSCRFRERIQREARRERNDRADR